MERTLDDYTTRELKDYIHGLIEADDFKEAKLVIRLLEKKTKKPTKTQIRFLNRVLAGNQGSLKCWAESTVATCERNGWIVVRFGGGHVEITESGKMVCERWME